MRLVVVTSVIGLLVPSVGKALANGISPLLALRMLLISMTSDARALPLGVARPAHQVLALVLLFGPMSPAGLIMGRLFHGAGPLATGQTSLLMAALTLNLIGYALSSAARWSMDDSEEQIAARMLAKGAPRRGSDRR